MNMKKKDIIIIVICVLVIIGSIYFIMQGFLKKSAPPSAQQSQETINFTGEIDKDAVEKLKTRKDYGTPPMDNIGRDNPFASL